MANSMSTPFPAADCLPDDLGEKMYDLVRRLYPINRSITGPGLRRTYDILSEIIDLSVSEVPSGTQVFDWQVPNEWTIRDAYIQDVKGNRVLDYKDHNLHVVGYSTPIDCVMPLAELKPHLHTLPEHPDWIPYRTSYYNESWGFCLTQNTLDSMKGDNYKVVIDSELKPGSLSYAEFVVEGETEDEFIFFAHTCHPSLCNDNLSGISVAALLADQLRKQRTRYTYRFIFAPATIGSITWMAQNEDQLKNIKCGLVLSVIGDRGNVVYKKSRQGNSFIDRAAIHVASTLTTSGEVRDFMPWGYDERQFCSPGINLAVGRLTRTPNGEFPEYHTSADDLSLVCPDSMQHSVETIWSIIEILENDRTYLNTQPKGEPQLGRRGLYGVMGGYQDIAQHQLAMLWILNQSDGSHSLLDIAIGSGIPFSVINSVAQKLVSKDLLISAGD